MAANNICVNVSSLSDDLKKNAVVVIRVLKVRNLGKNKLGQNVRPLVKVKIANKTIGSTDVASTKDAEPFFHETFLFFTSPHMEKITHDATIDLVVCSFNEVSPLDVGTASLPIAQGTAEPKWMPLKMVKGSGGEIMAHLFLIPESRAAASPELPFADFPLHSNCHVRLYQDAHTGDVLPGRPAQNAYEDMYHSVMNAKEFIYITGWSVWTELPMIRNESGDHGSKVLLGHILRDKAEAGVRVNILVWDEISSVPDKYGDPFVVEGVMGTFDEETRMFFQKTKVNVKAMFRAGPLHVEEVIMSHHQKTIICDEDVAGKRSVVAYVGGLDVTCGRFDTPKHPLFSSLSTLHKGDFYQTTCAVKVETGPRQPWHDIHCKLFGRVAMDVAQNFEERWVSKLDKTNINVANVSEKLVGVAGGVSKGLKGFAKKKKKKEEPAPAAPKAMVVEDDGGAMLYKKDHLGSAAPGNGAWKCQLLRSIDRYSVVQQKQGDVASIWRTIYNTYIFRICASQRFVFIENQYFQGSSYFWNAKVNPKAHNLIPLAITNKIVNKIHAGEPYAAYIIVPMFPEGEPATIGMQAMLHWQFYTVSMMYDRIAKALKEVGSSRHPTDYLVFMCLGNRENFPLPAAADNAHLCVKNRRHMIYVHSKFAIIDDEYVICGSANINDRSMRGNRDTEIAVCAHQPAGGAPKRDGEVQNFRLSLWQEHFGESPACFRAPESPECVARIQEIAKKNWELYSGDEIIDMDSHALIYPYNVSSDGVMEPSVPHFPDYPKAPINGKVTPLPSIVTT